MNKIEEFAVWLEEEYSKSIFQLMLEGAKFYFANLRRHRDDYITKKEIRELINTEIEQFTEQIPVINVVEEYCNETGNDVGEIIEELDSNKNMIIHELMTFVEGIAKEVNEED